VEICDVFRLKYKIANYEPLPETQRKEKDRRRDARGEQKTVWLHCATGIVNIVMPEKVNLGYSAKRNIRGITN